MASFFIVTGAGRSGTSAVARALHESGVCLGTSMAEASEANPEGFYEDLAVVDLNERILGDVGMNDPWRAERWPSRAAVGAAAARYRDEMSALVQTGVEGWKDPRFAITLEAWLPALTVRPRLVICLRSPRAYADSATRIYGLVKPARAMREWARHYRRLLAVARKHQLDAACIEYDALVEHPVETVGMLAKFVGRRLDASLIVPRLRREGGGVPATYQQLYDEVAALGGARRRPARAVVRPTPPPRAATQDYESKAQDIEARSREAKAAWESIVVLPDLTPGRQVQAACTSCSEALIDLQQQLASLVPPERLVAQHKKLVRRLNLDRMIVELAASAVATGNSRTRDAAIRAWRRFGR